MTSNVPRILSVEVQPPMRLVLHFEAAPEGRQVVNLAGWIERCGSDFAALAHPNTFARAAIGAFGGNVTWDEDEGELAIDSVHLEALAVEQHSFTGTDAREWQETLGLSDAEAADVVGLGALNWQSMKESSDALPLRCCPIVPRGPSRSVHRGGAYQRPQGRGGISKGKIAARGETRFYQSS